MVIEVLLASRKIVNRIQYIHSFIENGYPMLVKENATCGHLFIHSFSKSSDALLYLLFE